uniref:Uncharacterized protein n=1 Tax=Eutreptiella gymnastica TaxID=73025 RepID=A0A7S1N1V4_9EUGL
MLFVVLCEEQYHNSRTPNALKRTASFGSPCPDACQAPSLFSPLPFDLLLHESRQVTMGCVAPETLNSQPPTRSPALPKGQRAWNKDEAQPWAAPIPGCDFRLHGYPSPTLAAHAPCDPLLAPHQVRGRKRRGYLPGHGKHWHTPKYEGSQHGDHGGVSALHARDD